MKNRLTKYTIAHQKISNIESNRYTTEIVGIVAVHCDSNVAYEIIINYLHDPDKNERNTSVS